jgi:hypothetical protein
MLSKKAKAEAHDEIQIARLSILRALEALPIPTGNLCSHCKMTHYADGQRQLYRMRNDLEAFADKLERKASTIHHWETE